MTALNVTLHELSFKTQWCCILVQEIIINAKKVTEKIQRKETKSLAACKSKQTNNLKQKK